MQKTPDFMPEFRANLPRTSHVLSHDFGLTCTVAHLNPVFHTLMNPGETIKLGFNYNVRTQPLEAAAFGDFICHTEYFFVPMQLLYQPIDSVVFGIDDQFSSAFASGIQTRDLPIVDFDKVITDAFTNRGLPSLYYPDSGYPVESVGQSVIRFLDLMGFCPIGVACTDDDGGHFYNPNVFPYQVLAYNCIYQYYYRLDSRELFDQSSFNLDKYYGTSDPIQTYPYSNFRMKYRPLDNDYFTDVKVSPIVDVLNLSDKHNLSNVNSWLTRTQNGNYNIISSGGVGNSSSQQAGDSSNGTNWIDPGEEIQTQFGLYARQYSSYGVLSYNKDINTANIRAMFANEKLWSITGRAKKNYDDQTLAHFGFKVPHDVKHEISCFGHDVSKIHVGEVISTANTDLSPLGEIAGKGYGVQQVDNHSFTAPCHGVVMVIFSIVPVRNYEAGILKANCVASKEDFYMPEYDHLGMQPLFNYETQYYEQSSDEISGMVGWQYRYEQWKRRYNRVSGAFKNFTGSLKGWIPSFMPYNGSPAFMTESGKHQNYADTVSYQAFLNLPQDVNQLFLAQYPANWSESYESVSGWSGIYDNDPFIIHSHINGVLVSTMSDYSLPRLDV